MGLKKTMNETIQHSLQGAARDAGQPGASMRKVELASLGISGAWISNLTALEPYQPIFAATTFGFLGYGFYLVHRKRRVACAEDAYCARPTSGRVAKIGLWTATILAVIALGFPKIAPLFL
jgi:mercuric ion transport protein